MKFEPKGLLALAPSAYGQDFDHVKAETPQWIGGNAEPEAVAPPRPSLAAVWIRGPLMHHPQPWLPDQPCPPDSYDDIRLRVAYAITMRPAALLLVIDSPGGLVSGCFDTAKMVRAMCDAAGVSIHAYIDGQCCSAAYAWASVCETITAPPTAIVGSIGVLDTVLDATAADSQMGLKFALIASGARKTDTNPHAPMTAEALTAVQARVDDLALFFFSFVADHRIGMSAESVRALQAETFVATRAQTLRLVDNVMTLDALVASLNQDPRGNTSMAKSALLAAIVSAMSSDDEDEKKQARKAMSAICAEGGDDEGAPPPKKKEDEEARAEGESEGEPPKKKDEEARASAQPAAASAVAPAASAVASTDTTNARLDKIENDARVSRNLARAAERKSLLASRPDLSPAQLAVFSDPKQTPLEALRSLLPTISQPRGVQAQVPTAGATGAPPPAPTRGEGDGAVPVGATALSEYASTLDRQMGLSGSGPTAAGYTGTDPSLFVQPSLTPAQARAMLAAKKAVQ